MQLPNRILLAGFDRNANSELARNLAKNSPALVLAENEFQRAIEEKSKTWLSMVVNLEEFYRQDLLVLWFGSGDKRKLREQNPDNDLIIKYANELLFEHYSNKKLNVKKTHVYFVNISERVRYSELADIIKGEMGRGSVIQFSTQSPFVWDFPSSIVELIQN